MYREVADPKWTELFSCFNRSCDPQLFKTDNFEFVRSGKSAISLVLQFLKKEKWFMDKTEEILVPKWIGSWVYAQMFFHITPTTLISKNTKAIFVYHQYGFPQNMKKILEFARENRLLIIEDCAHAIAGSYNNTPIGEWADLTIYSFSKFFFSSALGGIRSKNKEFLEFVKDKKKNCSCFRSLFIDFSKLLENFAIKWNNQAMITLSQTCTPMAYSLYHYIYKAPTFSTKLALNKLDNEILTRRNYFELAKKELSQFGVFDKLLKDSDKDISPYVIPLFLEDEKLNKLVVQLKYNGFNTGVYWFDVERNMISPKFEKCLWILCHSGITSRDFEFQLSLIKDFLRNGYN